MSYYGMRLDKVVSELRSTGAGEQQCEFTLQAAGETEDLRAFLASAAELLLGQEQDTAELQDGSAPAPGSWEWCEGCDELPPAPEGQRELHMRVRGTRAQAASSLASVLEHLSMSERDMEDVDDPDDLAFIGEGWHPGRGGHAALRGVQ